MATDVKGLLQKINFVETDMELHKQILFSIPSENTAEIKKVVNTIADLKQQIQDLRDQIKQTDEAEYNKIIAIEQAADHFRQIAKDKKFVQVNTLNEDRHCFITFNDGTRQDCLVAAKEENGNWTVLTLEGETREYPGSLIQ
jgi:Fe2+ transport system protein B